MISFLEMFSPRKAWGRLWDTPRPTVTDFEHEERERLEERYKCRVYDRALPTVKSVGESGFDEGDACVQTPGDVTPTQEMVVTSTPVPGPLPHASEVRLVGEGKSENPAKAPGTSALGTTVYGSKNPPLFMGQQGNPLLFMGQQANPLLFMGQQRNPFRRRSRRFVFRKTMLVSFSPGGPWAPET
jgi:hypothetical protein